MNAHPIPSYILNHISESSLYSIFGLTLFGVLTGVHCVRGSRTWVPLSTLIQREREVILQCPQLSIELDNLLLHRHKVRPTVCLSSWSTQPVAASSDERGPSVHSVSNLWPKAKANYYSLSCSFSLYIYVCHQSICRRTCLRVALAWIRTQTDARQVGKQRSRYSTWNAPPPARPPGFALPRRLIVGSRHLAPDAPTHLAMRCWVRCVPIRCH